MISLSVFHACLHNRVAISEAAGDSTARKTTLPLRISSCEISFRAIGRDFRRRPTFGRSHRMIPEREIFVGGVWNTLRTLELLHNFWWTGPKLFWLRMCHRLFRLNWITGNGQSFSRPGLGDPLNADVRGLWRLCGCTATSFCTFDPGEPWRMRCLVIRSIFVRGLREHLTDEGWGSCVLMRFRCWILHVDIYGCQIAKINLYVLACWVMSDSLCEQCTYWRFVWWSFTVSSFVFRRPKYLL